MHFPAACETIGSKPEPCIFPFKYEGQKFDRCTSVDTEDGSLWCATEVDKDGNVLDGRWGDCNENCPEQVSNFNISLRCFRYIGYENYEFAFN